jgi:hypothetical protein
LISLEFGPLFLIVLDRLRGKRWRRKGAKIVNIMNKNEIKGVPEFVLFNEMLAVMEKVVEVWGLGVYSWHLTLEAKKP